MSFRSAEGRGRTVDEAVSSALEQAGLRPEEARVEVMDSGSKGFLGIGAREATVRVFPTLPAAETVRRLLTEILTAGDFDAQVAASEQPDGTIEIAVTGDELGGLIGRNGHTLDALQYLLNAAASRLPAGPRHVVLDVGGYRLRREESLKRAAAAAAQTAVRVAGPVRMEPMSAAERRLVHMALADRADVVTRSEGTEPLRRVVVEPRQ